MFTQRSSCAGPIRADKQHPPCRNRGCVQSLVRTAESLGYRALVVTVDAPFLGNRESDKINQFRMPDGLTLGNARHFPGGFAVMSSPAPADASGAPPVESAVAAPAVPPNSSALAKLFMDDVDASLTWDFLDWLQTITSLPILVKVRPRRTVAGAPADQIHPV